MRSALNCLLVAVLFAASLVPLGDATAEGDALFTMMQNWSVQFPGWVAGGNPCSPLWKYVQCTNGSVVELNVKNTGISGTIPSEVGLLQNLEVLDVSNIQGVESSNNSLKGPLPDSLAQLTRLRSLTLKLDRWSQCLFEFGHAKLSLRQMGKQWITVLQAVSSGDIAILFP
ncbi:unnamed protein product [Calypogeia fissa]